MYEYFTVEYFMGRYILIYLNTLIWYFYKGELIINVSVT